MIARASDDGHGTPNRYARQPDAALGGSSVTRLPSKQAQTAAVEETARPSAGCHGGVLTQSQNH